MCNYISFQYETNHFTQIIWANTSLIGCGLTKSKSKESYLFLLTCNFGPGGNIINEEIYTRKFRSNHSKLKTNKEHRLVLLDTHFS